MWDPLRMELADEKVSIAALALWIIGATSGPLFVHSWPPVDGWGMPTWLVILLLSGQFVVGLLAVIATRTRYGPFHVQLPVSWLAEYLGHLRERAIDNLPEHLGQDTRMSRRIRLALDFLSFLLAGTAAIIAYPDALDPMGVIIIGVVACLAYLLDKIDRREATHARQSDEPTDYSDFERD